MQGNPEGIDQWLIRVGKWLHFRIALSVAVITWTLHLQPIQKTNRKVTASVKNTYLIIQWLVDIAFQMKVIAAPVDQRDVTLWAFSTGK